jgi:hypothetical protein
MITVIPNSNTRQENSNHLDLNPFKVTALRYLHEALVKERYEAMTEIIHYAKEFGASESDVVQTLSS